MTYQERRQRNIAVFEDTKYWIQQEPALREVVRRSRDGTIYYAPGFPALLETCCSRFSGRAQILVSEDRTFQAAGKYQGQKVAVLNFASATNPGGGVTRGSSAQEESLCRCSTLYPCLTTDALWQQYYQMHRDRLDVTYTDACIYTPGVWIIKTDTDAPRRLPLEETQQVDVITCAAPNLRERPSNEMNPGGGAAVQLTDDQIYALHLERARKILAVAALHGAETVILGAFGCGAFRNPPQVVAAAFGDVLPSFAHAFRTVEFAVFCPPHDRSNYLTFRQVLSEIQG